MFVTCCCYKWKVGSNSFIWSVSVLWAFVWTHTEPEQERKQTSEPSLWCLLSFNKHCFFLENQAQPSITPSGPTLPTGVSVDWSQTLSKPPHAPLFLLESELSLSWCSCVSEDFDILWARMIKPSAMCSTELHLCNYDPWCCCFGVSCPLPFIFISPCLEQNNSRWRHTMCFLQRVSRLHT